MDFVSIDEEAELAECENCGFSSLRDEGIECEGCGGWLCFQCWKGYRGKNPHFCGKLTTQKGHLVQLGSQLYYLDRPSHVYQVVEIPKTFIDNMICYGTLLGKKEQEKVIIRPRLMEML